MLKRGLCRHAVSVCLCVCVSVCLSDMFVSCVKANKHIIKSFSPSGSHTIPVFSVPNGIAVFQWNPLTGASNAGGVGTNRDSEPIPGLTACVNAAIGQVL